MADLRYSMRASLPHFLTRGRENAIDDVVYGPTGAIATPSVGTITVYDESGAEAVTAAAATFPSSRPTYTVPAAAVPTTAPLSSRWQIRWSLTIDVDSSPLVFVREAHLVRSVFSCPVIPSDLTDAHQEAASLLAPGVDVQDFIRQGHEWVMRWLLRQGRLPWLMLDSSELFDVILAESLRRLFLDAHAATNGVGKYLELADRYAAEREAELARTTLTYDLDEDGLPGSDSEPIPVTPSVWLASPPWGSYLGGRRYSDGRT